MNNSGMSLIETIIASLISTIVLVCIASYVIVGNDNYRKSRSESYVEIENQSIINNITLKIKTCEGFTMYDSDDYSVLAVLTGEMTEIDYTYSLVEYIYILDKNNQNLYLINNGSKSNVTKYDEINTLLSTVTLSKNNLFSEIVYSINVTKPTNILDTININVVTGLGGRSCDRSVRVSIRNR